jgi:putative transposase
MGIDNLSKGWYYSGAAPHRDEPELTQFITFRLADSLPQSTLQGYAGELKRLTNRARRARIESWLDAGYGSCVLAHPPVAETLQQVLWHYHGELYRLRAWVVMPNHVHILIDPQASIARIVQRWKAYTATWVTRECPELALPKGRLWMRDYWDRYIRDERHHQTAVHYIRQNPVKAGLCDAPEAWRWSSAFPENAIRLEESA